MNIGIVLQGLQVGGMERGAIQLAHSARQCGHNAHLILYDVAKTGAKDEYDSGEIPIVFVPRKKGIDLTLPLRLARLFRAFKLDIVHARNNVAGFYSAAALRMLPAPPRLILTFHTFPGTGTAKARAASRWASVRADMVTSVSNELSNRLVSNGWVNHCRTTWNGVDTRVFTPEGPRYGLRTKLGLSNGTFIIGQLARLDDNKRQVDLIDAFTRLSRTHGDLALVIAGDGPSRRAIEEAACTGTNIFLPGTISDAASFLRDIDTFVLCSDDEGCPRALLEAMACGKAVVATSVGGVPEVLDGCGLLVHPREPAKLAETIRLCCQSAELRKQLGEMARKRIAESFTLEHEWRRYDKMYHNLLS